MLVQCASEFILSEHLITASSHQILTHINSTHPAIITESISRIFVQHTRSLRRAAPLHMGFSVRSPMRVIEAYRSSCNIYVGTISAIAQRHVMYYCSGRVEIIHSPSVVFLWTWRLQRPHCGAATAESAAATSESCITPVTSCGTPKQQRAADADDREDVIPVRRRRDLGAFCTVCTRGGTVLRGSMASACLLPSFANMLHIV